MDEIIFSQQRDWFVWIFFIGSLLAKKIEKMSWMLGTTLWI
jgi:hypothetical protein